MPTPTAAARSIAQKRPASFWRLGCFMALACWGLFVASGSVQAQGVTQPPGPRVQPLAQPVVPSAQANLILDTQGRYAAVPYLPWFSDANIRQQLSMTDAQFNLLDRSWRQNYQTYQQNTTTLTDPATREERLRRLDEQFHRDFNSTTAAILNSAGQRDRYQQLFLQYQGFHAFADPTIQQRLRLNDPQRLELRQQSQDWNLQMELMRQNWSTKQAEVLAQFNTLQDDAAKRLNSILRPDQQVLWQELTGKPHRFPATAYFAAPQSSTPQPTTLQPATPAVPATPQ